MIDPKRVEEARAVIRAQMTQQSPQPGSQSNQGSQGDIGAQVRQKIQSAGLGAPKQTTSYTPTGQGGFQSMPGNRIASISEVTEPARNVVKGFGKSLAKIGQTILKPIDSGLAKLGIKGATTSGGDLSDENLKRNGFWQGVGGFTGDTLYGGAVLGAASPLATTITKSSLALKAPGVVQKLVDVTGRSALDASLGYGTSKLFGYDNEQSKTNALISGAIPWVSAAFSGAVKLVGGQKLGEKIQTAFIKPSKKDLANGFDIKNINKYGLGGNLEQTAEKTQGAILERVTKLKSQLKPGSATVDLNKTLSTLVDELDNVKLENAGSNLALKRELEKFVQEIKLLSGDGVIDIADAQRIKQAFGAKGAWEFGVPREEANAIEEVYTKAYNILKTQIEDAAASTGNTLVRQINKELSDLIPIEHALIRRLPIAARQNPISLTDLVSAIGGAKLGLPLYILNKASKSGNVGSMLAGVGSRPYSRGALGTLISGPGIKQLENAPSIRDLNIPKVNVGLSIKSIKPKTASEITEAGVDTGSSFYNRLNKYEAEALKKAAPPKGKGAIPNQLATEAKKYKSAVDYNVISKKGGQPLENIAPNHPTANISIKDFQAGNRVMDGSIDGKVQYDKSTPSIYWLDKIKGGERPPVLVGGKGKTGLQVLDGNNRMAAYNQLGIDVPVIFTKTAKSQLTEIWNKAHEVKAPKVSLQDKITAKDPLTQEALKYKRTVNIQDKNDLEYLGRILSQDQIADIKAGKTTNFRGKSYEDLARVNIISKTPQTIEQQLAGKIKDIKLKSDTFYHGTSAENARGIMSSGFKNGGQLPEDTFRGGGYGQIQNSISLTETPKDASRFSTLSKNGEIVEAQLKPNSKVVSIEGIEDAVDLEDFIPYLKKQKIDAVYIGGGEKELVVINSKVISPTKSQLTEIWNKAHGIKKLNAQWIKSPTKANRNALDKAIQLYKYLVRR